MIPPEDRRNYSAIYNKITLDQLQTMVKKLKVDQFILLCANTGWLLRLFLPLCYRLAQALTLPHI